MTNKLIESTIAFVENTSRINGNLRSGVIKEETEDFPIDHVKAGLEMHKQNKKDGALESESEGMLAHHARTKLGYEPSKAEDFASHVTSLHDSIRYASGKRSSLDKENMHGAIKDHLKSKGLM